jgi:hypothetical protein
LFGWGFTDNHHNSIGIIDELVLTHFGISEIEAYKLFDQDGCNNAKRPLTAAKYIERFVEAQP